MSKFIRLTNAHTKRTLFIKLDEVTALSEGETFNTIDCGSSCYDFSEDFHSVVSKTVKEFVSPITYNFVTQKEDKNV